ncbi:unnamed protein product [Amoebophrya sp. A25]|nr:unnamed protein product [Amoebophrya sp. A25]|eukprot:GSA25T00003642001.1
MPTSSPRTTDSNNSRSPQHHLPSSTVQAVNFCPALTHVVRRAFGLSTSTFVEEMAHLEGGNKGEGKSDSVFFASKTGQFCVKSVKEEEHRLLVSNSLLQDYTADVILKRSQETLLPHFYMLLKLVFVDAPAPDNIGGLGGLDLDYTGHQRELQPHPIETSLRGTTLRLVVMQNVFLAGGRVLHERYDLKGSFFNRWTELAAEKIDSKAAGAGGTPSSTTSSSRITASCTSSSTSAITLSTSPSGSSSSRASRGILINDPTTRTTSAYAQQVDSPPIDLEDISSFTGVQKTPAPSSRPSYATSVSSNSGGSSSSSSSIFSASTTTLPSTSNSRLTTRKTLLSEDLYRKTLKDQNFLLDGSRSISFTPYGQPAWKGLKSKSLTTYQTLARALRDDARWLAKHRLMDYSLLLGLHFVGKDPSTTSSREVVGGSVLNHLNHAPSGSGRSTTAVGTTARTSLSGESTILGSSSIVATTGSREQDHARSSPNKNYMAEQVEQITTKRRRGSFHRASRNGHRKGARRRLRSAPPVLVFSKKRLGILDEDISETTTASSKDKRRQTVATSFLSRRKTVGVGPSSSARGDVRSAGEVRTSPNEDGKTINSVGPPTALPAVPESRTTTTATTLINSTASSSSRPSKQQKSSRRKTLADRTEAASAYNLWLHAPLEGVHRYRGRTSNVLVFVGIVDILQVYSLKKYTENLFKEKILFQQNISAVEPQEYADRFLQFLLRRCFREQRILNYGSSAAPHVPSAKTTRIGGVSTLVASSGGAQQPIGRGGDVRTTTTVSDYVDQKSSPRVVGDHVTPPSTKPPVISTATYTTGGAPSGGTTQRR